MLKEYSYNYFRKQGDYFMAKIAKLKNQCEYFGNPDGMIGSCVDCSVENESLWEKCIECSHAVEGVKKRR